MSLETLRARLVDRLAPEHLEIIAADAEGLAAHALAVRIRRER